MLFFPKMGSNTLDRKASVSEPALETAFRDYFGFPPGTTVDELRYYRRKRPVEHLPQDNLKLLDGSFKAIKSEYRRRFRNFYRSSGNGSASDSDLLASQYYGRLFPALPIKPDDTLKLEGELEFQPEYYESFIRYTPAVETDGGGVGGGETISDIEIDDERPSSTRTSHPAQHILNNNNSNNSNVNDKGLPNANSSFKVIHSDMYKKEEDMQVKVDLKRYNSFPPPSKKIRSRARHPLRKPTTLKLEGEMEIKTESRDQFVPYILEKRPPLCKKLTNLHLEGAMNITTEKQEQFIQFPVKRRPELTKSATNLRLEGELVFMPEYRRQYVHHHSLERAQKCLPVNNLKSSRFSGDGNMFSSSTPELVSIYNQSRNNVIHPVIPNLRESSCPSSRASSRPQSRCASRSGSRPVSRSNSRPSSRAGLLPAKSSFSGGDGGSIRPMQETYQLNYAKAKRKTDIKPVSSSSTALEHGRNYGNLAARERDHHQKVMAKRFDRSTRFISDGGGGKAEYEKKYSKVKSEPFLPYLTTRTDSEDNFSMLEPKSSSDGRFECQPEYRKAYIDYLIRERIERKPRTISKSFELMTKEPNSTAEETGSITSNSAIEKPEPKKDDPILDPSKAIEEHLSQRFDSKNLAKLEATAFGPKLTVPARKSSSKSMKSSSSSSSTLPPVHPSPRFPKSNNTMSDKQIRITSTSSTSDSDLLRRNQRNRKFDRAIRVENMAKRFEEMSGTTGGLLKNGITKSKWMRDDSTQSDTAFYVLDNESYSRNNNNYFEN